MKCRLISRLLLGLWLLAAARTTPAAYRPTQVAPPPPTREFRGVWVATVNNIDWPSKPGLSAAQQKTELRRLLDYAVQLRLNAIIFQVRPACDAIYPSPREPWSEYLTGVMGQAPSPFYDPLQLAVEEAHRRGLELHAWFNPFRAKHSSSQTAASSDHVSRCHPQWVRSYGKELWLDPGEPAARDYSVEVILDVVRRYDVDGIHIDDYFYPYPEKDASGQEIDFPDETTWKRYQRTGGKLDRHDWRRENVNGFVRRLYQETKVRKPWVKVGISPFGIWRPGFPVSVRGFDAYEKLYADSRRWLLSGWLDYCAPQLYWSIDAPGQSYPVLLQWWRDQNLLHRHLWPGNSVYRASSQPGELDSEIRLTRRQTENSGNLLWSMKALQQNKNGQAASLVRSVYGTAALVPACPWLDQQPPPSPALAAKARGSSWMFTWHSAHGEAVWLWVLQRKERDGWRTEILPNSQTTLRLGSGESSPAVVALRAVDRCGNLSAPVALQNPGH